MGFEPMKELLLYTLSKRAPSTARPPLHDDILSYNELVIMKKSIIFIKIYVFNITSRKYFWYSKK